MTHVAYADVSSNRLSGVLPACLATNIPRLQRFIAHDNNFTGTVPASFRTMVNLSVIGAERVLGHAYACSV